MSYRSAEARRLLRAALREVLDTYRRKRNLQLVIASASIVELTIFEAIRDGVLEARTRRINAPRLAPLRPNIETAPPPDWNVHLDRWEESLLGLRQSLEELRAHAETLEIPEGAPSADRHRYRGFLARAAFIEWALRVTDAPELPSGTVN